VQLFSYLTDKDFFADIYRNQLAKRLLNGRSKSDDAERTMIQKLKLRCGAQFTSSMEGMINDLNIAADHLRDFETHLQNVDAGEMPVPEFKVRVLTTGFWPTYQVTNVRLPKAMNDCIVAFEKWYTGKTSHRTIKFMYSLGSAVVRGHFKKWYDMQVTTLQAALLMCFNTGKEATFQSLCTQTNLSDEVMKRALHSLSCGRYRILLKSNPKSRTIRITDKFKVNPKFSCPMRRVRIPMASLNVSHDKKRVTEDRSIAIEAAIVRIMKARKVLAHQKLVTEVLSQLAFFKPNPKVVKRRIEHLIDREYLARHKDQKNVYRYLA